MTLITSKDLTPIAYQQTGNGEPLVLIHGTSGDHSSWNPVLPLLEPYFSIYNLDRRGRGQSGDNTAYSILHEAQDIAAVVDSIGGNVNVLAHSFGALCSLEATLLTDNIKQLILYEPPLSLADTVWSDEFNQQMLTALADGDLENVVLMFYCDLLKISPDDIAAMQANPTWSERIKEAHTIQRELQHIAAYQFQAERFAGITLPTSLFLGSLSPKRRYHVADTLHQALANSQIVLLDNQGHSAIRTAPELFAQTVIATLM